MLVRSKSGCRAVGTRPKLPIPVPAPRHAAYNPVMSDLRKPSFGFWAMILLMTIPAVYVLAFGPACALVYRDSLPGETALVYRPLLRAAKSDVSPMAVPLRWYVGVFMPDVKSVGWRSTSKKKV